MAEFDNVAHGFSWKDSVQAALAPCLGCLNSYCGSGPSSRSGDENESNSASGLVSNGFTRWRWRQRQGQSNPSSVDQSEEDAADRRRAEYYGELEGLLADASDTDNDAERMSLHSTIGTNRKSRSKKKSKKGKEKSVKLFGWDMFGRRRAQPIELPSSDDEDDDLGNARRHANLSNHYTSGSTASLSAFDSDAAPLDPDSIPTVVETRNQDHHMNEADGDSVSEVGSGKGKHSSKSGKRKGRKSGHVAPQLHLDFEPSYAEDLTGNTSYVDPSQALTPPSSDDQLLLPRLDVNLPTSPFAPFSVPLPPQPGPTLDNLGIVYISPPSHDQLGFTLHPPNITEHDHQELEGDADADFGGEMYSRKAPTSSIHSGGSASNSRSGSGSQGGSASYYRRQEPMYVPVNPYMAHANYHHPSHHRSQSLSQVPTQPGMIGPTGKPSKRSKKTTASTTSSSRRSNATTRTTRSASITSASIDTPLASGLMSPSAFPLPESPFASSHGTFKTKHSDSNLIIGVTDHLSHDDEQQAFEGFPQDGVPLVSPPNSANEMRGFPSTGLFRSNTSGNGNGGSEVSFGAKQQDAIAFLASKDL